MTWNKFAVGDGVVYHSLQWGMDGFGYTDRFAKVVEVVGDYLLLLEFVDQRRDWSAALFCKAHVEHDWLELEDEITREPYEACRVCDEMRVVA